MYQHDLTLALAGGIFALSAVAGVHFWKYWRESGDRLFIFFALAFWIFATERAALVWMEITTDKHPIVYLLRLISFLLIAIGIIDKNRRRRL